MFESSFNGSGQGMSTSGPAFSSSRIVRFSDLADEEKESFIKFFAEQRVDFFKDSDGSYVANIRLYDPEVLDGGVDARSKSKKTDRKGERSGRRGGDGSGTSDASAAADAAMMSRLVGSLGGSAAALDYSVYPRFTALVCARDTVRPKARPLAWVMRVIEEVYEVRYAKDTADLRTGAGSGSDGENEGGGGSTPFPVFVVEFFSKRYGLQSLVDQMAWDLLANVHAMRRQYLEVEIFARFLEEYYDPDDLLFYLYVRSVIQKELGVSFRARWTELGRAGAEAAAAAAASGKKASQGAPPSGPPPVYLTFRECCVVARVVFGSESDPLYRTFIALVERACEGEKRPRADTRRIEATAFLHQALVEYHETRPVEGGGGSGGGVSPSGGGDGSTGGADAEALFRDASARYEDRMRGGGASSSSPGGGGGGGGGSPSGGGGGGMDAMLEAVGEAMHAANEAYLDALLRAALAQHTGGSGSGSGLPPEVVDQIRAEVQTQLEARVDGVLGGVINVSQGERAGSGPGAAAAERELAPLVARFQRMQAASMQGRLDASEVDAFCAAVLALPDLRKSVEELVTLLVGYAASRLTGTA